MTDYDWFSITLNTPFFSTAQNCGKFVAERSAVLDFFIHHGLQVDYRHFKIACEESGHMEMHAGTWSHSRRGKVVAWVTDRLHFYFTFFSCLHQFDGVAILFR